jgi:hypothetical protein
MSVRDELLKFKNSKKQQLQEQSVYRNYQGVQPDKMDYRRPIPDPDILPDCFTAILKSEINMISYNIHSLRNESQKRINSVDLLFDPKAPSSELGITIMKDGKPFCFIKK